MPSFASQGFGLEEALFELGLLCPPFYDAIQPAEPAAIDALEALWGAPLPAVYRQFLGRAGGSLGPLRIVDWRTPWDFRPQPLVDHLAADPAALDPLRDKGLLPIARIGPSMELGYDDERCLLFEVATGRVVPDDPDRPDHECLVALLLEWGHRVLDPHMAVPGGRARLWSGEPLTPAQLDAVHALATDRQHEGDARHRGLRLGVYRFHHSGVLLRQDQPNQLWVEARCAARQDPERTAAHAVLTEGRRLGLLRS